MKKVSLKIIWREKCTEKKELGFIKRIYLSNPNCSKRFS